MTDYDDLTFGVIHDTGIGQDPEELEPLGDEEDGIEPIEAEGDEGAGKDDPEDDPSVEGET